MSDPINHPRHYTSHPSGVECIEIVESLPFCLGNAIKYVFRAGLKTDAGEDLKKALWYLRRERARMNLEGLVGVAFHSSTTRAVSRLVEHGDGTVLGKVLGVIFIERRHFVTPDQLVRAELEIEVELRKLNDRETLPAPPDDDEPAMGDAPLFVGGAP